MIKNQGPISANLVLLYQAASNRLPIVRRRCFISSFKELNGANSGTRNTRYYCMRYSGTCTTLYRDRISLPKY